MKDYLDLKGLSHYDEKIKNELSLKQDQLIAGEHVTIQDNVISVSSGPGQSYIEDIRVNNESIIKESIANINTETWEFELWDGTIITKQILLDPMDGKGYGWSKIEDFQLNGTSIIDNKIVNLKADEWLFITNDNQLSNRKVLIYED